MIARTDIPLIVQAGRESGRSEEFFETHILSSTLVDLCQSEGCSTTLPQTVAIAGSFRKSWCLYSSISILSSPNYPRPFPTEFTTTLQGA